MRRLRLFAFCLAASRQRRLTARFLGSVLAALLVIGPGQAQPRGNPADGHLLATTWCSSCHQIGPQAGSSANDVVPSFPAVAVMPSTTEMSIRVFLSTSHAVMPNYQLTQVQIADVGAYILSLRASPAR